MPSLKTITSFLGKELDIKSIHDAAKNGLQVRACNRVSKVCFAVDACMSIFEKTKKFGAELIIVHHGIFWKGFKDDMGRNKKYITYLKKNGVSLYACHLPLDMHMKYGNNIGLARVLGLENVKKFGRYHRVKIGVRGKLPRPQSISSLASFLNKKLKTRCVALSFGKKKVRSVGIVSGGADYGAIKDAWLEKLDCYITGELQHHVYHFAKDLGLNIIAAGHYHTETRGVKALQSLIVEKFGVNTRFIDVPTPI